MINCGLGCLVANTRVLPIRHPGPGRRGGLAPQVLAGLVGRQAALDGHAGYSRPVTSSTERAGSLPADQAAWHVGLPSFTANAGALISDTSGAILLVKPSYRDEWTIPGGVTEADESPRECAEREVGEEIGLTITMAVLLVVHWVAPAGVRRGTFSFVFDGGVLDDPGRIRLQDVELDDYAFLPVAEALGRVADRTTAPRIAAAVRARREGCPAYLEGSR
jgi:8-oxo-dGTP diphosphatase